MKRIFFVVLAGILINSCTTSPTILVNDIDELNKAIDSAVPGDQIIMANGVWKDVQIQFKGEGTAQNPIVIKAETSGQVFIEGESNLQFGGNYLTVNGLYFRNGYTPSRSVVGFRIDDQVANHCRLENSVIEDYTQPERDMQDFWVEFHGKHNQLDHCYLAGKSNRGPTVRVTLRGNESVWNYHKITNNHFGPRPRKGGPSAETIQIGTSSSSVSPSYTLVANNFFDRCNGEVEVISSKTNFNEFRNNVFFQSEGSLVTRHGNYCIIDGNYFIGDGTANIGGVRLINTGHWVTNNYFYNLKGKQFRSPLAVMNGIPKSPQNRYNQVTDIVVAYNTWIDCESPWHFGVGQNLDMKDVLPASEIRSARPARSILANNIIYNKNNASIPYVAHDSIDGISFKSNIINWDYENKVDGLETFEFTVTKLSDYIVVPGSEIANIEAYNGFEFENINKDLFGNSRGTASLVGSVNSENATAPDILNPQNYGAPWFNPAKDDVEPNIHTISPTDNIAEVIEKAVSGDIIILNDGDYEIEQSLKIDKELVIKSESDQAKIIYNGEEGTPLFEMNPKGTLTLEKLALAGNGSNYAFATLKKGMSSHYNLEINASTIENFDYVLKAYKQSFADSISVIGSKVLNCNNGLELSEETNDRGDYNTEFLTIIDSEFKNVKSNVVDYYRGGYDESTIGGNLLIKNSKFESCGSAEPNKILLNHRGIINVNLLDNNFRNNKVKFVSILWGAKNNQHSGNVLVNSGEIKTEENIALKLMY